MSQCSEDDDVIDDRRTHRKERKRNFECVSPQNIMEGNAGGVLMMSLESSSSCLDGVIRKKILFH